MSRFAAFTALAVVLGLGALMTARQTTQSARAADAPKADAKSRFFEKRTYTTNPGKLDALNARFRDHTNRIFAKHGIEIIGFWIPTDPERSKDTLIYIVAYPSQEAREQSWKDFQADPEWQKAKADSEKNGVLVKHVDSVYMTPTDYSPIK